ncbi:MAG: methyltransferase domain-containing protein, partial [Actinobacteria bacterium]|nr:methyltransferase domain-containing protein [Actinomycetota bacterium]
MAFDPIHYKTTTRQQWEDAAEAWHRWGPTLEAWLGEATERMLDAAGVANGSRVLDVAAGAGGQTLAAARRVGSTGHVLATDISPSILTYAAKAAAEAGLTNVETVEADGERLEDFAASSFDAVISRVGLIYFPDQQRALAGMRRLLRDGGRLAAIVFRPGRFWKCRRRRAGSPSPFCGDPVGRAPRRSPDSPAEESDPFPERSAPAVPEAMSRPVLRAASMKLATQ